MSDATSSTTKSSFPSDRGNLFAYGCFALAAILLPYSVHRVFLETPIEAQMGTAYKIFFFHVPLAWVFMLFAFCCGIAAFIQIRKRSERAAAWAQAFAEVAVLAGLCVMVTGPIWGNATWGKPWTGDARLVSTALLWLVFIAYLIIRKFGPANGERIAASLASFGIVLVPLVYYSVKIWKTIHPQTTVVGSLPAELWSSLWVCVGGLLALSLGLVWTRAKLEITSQQLDKCWVELGDFDNAGAPEAMPTRK